MHWLKSKQFKLAVSLLVSGVLLLIIYRKVDLPALKETLLNLAVVPSAVFFILIFIQLALSAWRWNIFTHQLGSVKLTFITSVQQVVGSYSANLLVPGKWGEIVRIPWMRKYKLAVPVIFLVLLEKVMDTVSVLSILFISVLILVVTRYPGPVPLAPILIISGAILLALLIMVVFRKRLGTLLKMIPWLSAKLEKPESLLFKGKSVIEMAGNKFWVYYGFSFILWTLQVLQFYFIFLMLGITPSLIYTYAGSCLALFAGVIPVSVAGMGTRDAVIVGFFNHLAAYEVLAGVGILSLLRIIIPALLGIPFFIIQTKES
jgi:uncharacterized protein (TIRG00374 family)